MTGGQGWAVVGLLAAFLGQMSVERFTWMRRIDDKLDHISETLIRLDQKLTDHVEHHPGEIA